jgi:hypothetical protein
MTLRYAALADGTVRDAYDAAMTKLRGRHDLPLVIASRPAVPDRVTWLRSEMLKTRVAHGYCSRQLAAEVCPYANICEQCDNFTTTAEFLPQLQNQLVDAVALRDDAEAAAGTARSPGTPASSPASNDTPTGSNQHRAMRRVDPARRAR